MTKNIEPCTSEESLKIQKQLKENIYSHSIEIQNHFKNNDCESMKKESEELCDNYYELKREEGYLDYPPDTSLPFFAYGIFKPEQIAYPRIEEFVKSKEIGYTEHTLYERDGIPFINEKDTNFKTMGYIIDFDEKTSELAYDIIRKTESSKFYDWGTDDVIINETNKKQANILYGKKVTRSNPVRIDEDNYDGSRDIFFFDALDIIGNELNDYKLEKGKKGFENFIKLQRNYMLLWAAIDRYNSLKYGENNQWQNCLKLARENVFIKSLEDVVIDWEDRIVYDSQSHNKKVLNPNKPRNSMDYYYTMRSNVVHRGKSVIPIDEKNLRKSL